MLGLYEVIYKLALPEGHGGVSSTPSDDDYSPLPPSDPAPDSSSSSAFHHRHYRTSTTPDIPLEPPSPVVEELPLQRNTSISQLIVPKTESARQIHDLEYPIPLPPALHANFLTSCIGIATLLLLWPPIIWLDWMGYEVFKWPGAGGGAGGKIWLGLEVVAWGGALYVSVRYIRTRMSYINHISERRPYGPNWHMGTYNLLGRKSAGYRPCCHSGCVVDRRTSRPANIYRGGDDLRWLWCPVMGR